MPNYAKRVDVQIPQLNDEGEVTEVKDKEQKKRRKSKVCWMLHVSAWGGERTARGRQHSEFGIALFFPTPAFGLPHPEQFTGTGLAQHLPTLEGVWQAFPDFCLTPMCPQSGTILGPGAFFPQNKGCSSHPSIYATEHGLGTALD